MKVLVNETKLKYKYIVTQLDQSVIDLIASINKVRTQTQTQSSTKRGLKKVRT